MAKRIPHCLAIWIDHKEAVVIDTLDPKASRNSKIFTIAGPHHKKNGNSRRGADSHRREDLKEFYDSVIQYLNKAETVLIIGPAQAKFELRERIQHYKKLKYLPLTLQNAPPLNEHALLRRITRYFAQQYGF